MVKTLIIAAAILAVTCDVSLQKKPAPYFELLARYSHLSSGAWASSPPLPLVVDFDQFKAATGPAYHTVGRNACYNTFEKAFNRTVKHWDADEFDIFIRTCDSLEEEGAAELYAILSTFQYEEFIQSRCDCIIANLSSIGSDALNLNESVDIDAEEYVNIDYKLVTWSLTCTIIALSAWHLFIRKETCFTEKNIKFVRGIPLLGSLWRSFFGLEHFTNSFEKIYAKFPEERIVGFYDLFNSPKYMIRDVELIKQIAIKDFDYFVNHSFYVDDNNDPFFGRSLFVLRDQRWRKMRATLSPAFTGRRMRLMFTLTNEVAETFGKYLSCDLVDGQKDFDMKDILTRFCNDVIASTAFGLNVNSLKHRENEFYKVAKSISEFGFGEMLKLFLYSVEKLSRRISVRLIKRYDEKYLKDIILSTMEFREKNNVFRSDMLNILMELKRGTSLAEDDDDAETNVEASTSEIIDWSDNDLLAQCMLFLLAGFGTVSLTLCFMVHEICVNPDVQERLYNEIQGVKSKLNRQVVTYEALNNMKYMNQVLLETMRRWPQSGFSSRLVNTPYVVENSEGKKINLNVGDVLVIPSNAIHADEKYYPNPTKFDPERFSDENKDAIPMGAFLAFGIGPRACIASRFAAMEIKSCIYHLLDQFSFEMCAKTQHPIKLKATSGNIEGEKGFWVRLKSRQNRPFQ